MVKIFSVRPYSTRRPSQKKAVWSETRVRAITRAFNPGVPIYCLTLLVAVFSPLASVFLTFAVLLSLEGEGHGGWSEKDNEALWTAVAGFLRAHLDAKPPG